MNNNKFSVTLFLILLFALPCMTNGQNKTISFDLKDVERMDVKKQEKGYEKIVMKKAFHTYDAGKPDLPVFYYKFYVPKGKKVTNVAFNSTEKTEIILHSDLISSQHPNISHKGNDTLFDEPDLAIYGKNSFYPENQAKILRSDFIDGDMEVVTVAVYPMQYNPKQRKIILSTNGKLCLTTSSKTADHSNVFEDHSNRSETASLIKTFVENPDDVNTDANKISTETVESNNLKSTTVAWSVPFYEYVIITTRSLKPAFNQFLTWKKRKGYNAGIVCIEDIIADQAATGDTMSSPALVDSAGKLRQYLNAGYINTSPKTKYALLGGDYTVVPIRYGKGGYDDEWEDGTGKIPTDLYFSDFNTNWTAVSTIMTGSCYLGFDYGPEIFVGRLLCNSEADVKTWTTKVLQYEQYPGNGNYSYLSKALFTEADMIGVEDHSSELPSIFTPPTIFSELPSDSAFQPYFPTGSDVISELNTNYGLYCSFNHGNPNGFGTATSYENLGYKPSLWRYKVTSSDNYTSENSTPENGNGFDNLTNYNFPTIVYSISCSNMPYDDFDEWGINQKIPTGSRTLGTSFTVAYMGGGPSYIGYTRYAERENSHHLMTLFFDSISTFPQLGIALAKSKIGNGDESFWNSFALNLLGCPETELWTATPTAFSSASVTPSGTSLIVNAGVSGSTICVMGALDNGSSYYVVKNNVSTWTFPNVSSVPYYYVTIDKQNKIPYRKDPTTVLIENKTFSSLTYLNCQTVSAGYSADPNHTPDGNVVISNGANVTFDATGDILLDSGFEVQLGATFEAK